MLYNVGKIWVCGVQTESFYLYIMERFITINRLSTPTTELRLSGLSPPHVWYFISSTPYPSEHNRASGGSIA